MDHIFVALLIIIILYREKNILKFYIFFYIHQVTLHCGEIPNQQEITEMLKFRPERIGHGVCIHPNYGGNEEIWQLLCKSQIPVGEKDS